MLWIPAHWTEFMHNDLSLAFPTACTLVVTFFFLNKSIREFLNCFLLLLFRCVKQFHVSLTQYWLSSIKICLFTFAFSNPTLNTLWFSTSYSSFALNHTFKAKVERMFDQQRIQTNVRLKSYYVFFPTNFLNLILNQGWQRVSVNIKPFFLFHVRQYLSITVSYSEFQGFRS